MAYKQDPEAAAPSDPSSTRQRLLDAAAARFLAQGHAGVSLAEIAQAVGAYPNQVTHHFGSKDGLFVEAACLLVLREARCVEALVAGMSTVEAHVRGTIAHLLGPGSPAVMRFAQAMLLARPTAPLRERVQATLHQLHEAAERNLRATCERNGWASAIDAAAVSRAFWAAVLGLALEKAAMGDAFDPQSAEAVALALMQLKR